MVVTLFRAKGVNPHVAWQRSPRVMNACSYSYVDVASNADRPLQRVTVQSLGFGARVQIAGYLQALANSMSTPYPLKIQPVTPRSCACIACISEPVRSV